MVNRYTLLFSLLMLLVSQAKAQRGVEQVIQPLEAWAKDFPQEKVHVHLDKPYYIAGDTVWFKTYTVIGARHQLSSMSGAIYVDLISSTDSVISSLKLPVMAGMAKGNIDLPVDLRPGNYRLRAYTQWMRNAGSDYFYDRPLFIGSMNPDGIQTEATLQYDKAEGKVSGMQIRFTDARGQALANKSVDYMMRTPSELLSRRRTMTNSEGVLLIPLNEQVLRDTASAFVVSEISLEKKKTATHIFPIQVKYERADVQFFPESGDLVAGLPCRVAFKAIGTDGLGITVKGVLLNEEQQALAEFNSIHAGMGQFMFTPEPAKTYTAKITFPDGSVKSFTLPEVRLSGYILSVYPETSKDTLIARIMSSADLLGQPVSIIAQADGEVLYAADLTLNRPLSTLHIPLQQQSGVVQFTLFRDGQAVNERLVYIEQPDTLSLTLEGASDSSKPRSEKKIALLVKDRKGNPVMGNFSMAVIDENQIPVKEEEETTIFSQLLLQSSLKGYIEQPNYYFTRVDDEKRDHLDLLMMTQGYRRFVWKDLLAGNHNKPTYPAEKVVSSISGKLLTLRNGKPVPNGKITLFSAAANIALDTVTDANGHFVFDNLLLTDSIKFTIQGRTDKGSDKVEIILDGIPSMEVTPNKNMPDFSLNVNQRLKTYKESTERHDQELTALGLESRMIKLNEVIVTSKMEKKLPVSYNRNGPGRADQVISGNELGTCPTLRMCLEGRLRGVLFRTEQTKIGPVTFPTSTRGGRMQLFIDGRQLRLDDDGDLMDLVGIFEQNLIDPTQILSIEVMRSPSLTNMYGAEAIAGVILINTKGWSPTQRTDYSVQLYAPKGFSNVREFYTPKYGVSERMDALADQRSTVYWNPAIPVGKDGRAYVSFFNTKNAGTYRITIEGVGANGQLARKVIQYHVNE